MKRKGINCFLAFILICSLLFPYTYETHAFASDEDTPDLIVSAEILYLREGPGLSYPILETLKQGEELTFIEKQDDWYHVKVNNVEGWVASWLTSTPKNSETEQPASTVISQVDHLNIRAEASISSPVLNQLNVGDEAEVLATENDWVKISYNGTVGWVSSEYVIKNKKHTTEQSESVKDETSSTKSAKTSAEVNPKLFTIAVDAVNVRKKPDLSSKKIGTAKKNEQYEVLDRENNWVKIQHGKEKGWVYSFYGHFQEIEKIPTAATSDTPSTDQSTVTIIYNGTNLREVPSTSSNVVLRANAGEKYPILSTKDDWYEVELDKNTSAYVANWVVSVDEEVAISEDTTQQQEPKEQRKKGTLKGVQIVIDPGHGGNDRGTTGVSGTEEKDINLKTVELLTSKLRSAGADVILTRESDTYVDLRKRVSISHQNGADAFISIHYDATEDSSISGFTTYYTNSYQRELAEYVHNGLSEKVTIRDRGVQPGNYLVTRENKQPAILIELGYLSNPSEERIVTTDYYREQATLGIYQGILDYFDAQLEN
ncbi:SH3 domain-containing protein [Ureibacillus sp. 179-F W5.1 NHS]|uniref:SH3 domain-containing protein n=1 Tax=Ureibacillus sp. 179-F W5.1 NHS TaxID=3374297 RepID=UPI00387A5017